MKLPGRCVACRRNVFYSNREWRDRNGGQHHCPDRSQWPWCAAFMPNAKEWCARRPGHSGEHRTRYALDNALRMKTGNAA